MGYLREMLYNLIYKLNKRRRFLTFTLVILVLYSVINLYYKEKTVPIEYIHYQALLKTDLVQNQCKVPQLNPWDPSIISYFSKPSPLKCKPFLLNVTYMHNGVLKINDEYKGKVNCKYRYFERNEGVDDTKLKYDDWINMVLPELELTKEFVEIECVKKGSLIGGTYTYQWATVIPKEVNIHKKEILEESADYPSVIMIGLDSMSRGNFIRQLPETYNVLQEQGFVGMDSHVKVLDNTYGNWLAIMTGKTATTTKEFNGELRDEWNIFFDDFDLIWKHYSNKSYATLFAEDRPDIGTFNYFNYLNGFKHSPTDHYFRPYWLSCYWSLAFRRSTTGCYDSMPLHKIQLQYLQDFLTNYSNKRKFAWWWTQDLSHDHLNQIGVVDNDLADFLVKNEKNLEKSIVIVFSDHGHRYASIRETVVGRLEARLPFLSIKIPDVLKKKYPWITRNLEYNSKLMTTQYDLHETLIHVVEDGFRKNKDITPPKMIQRAFSLFRKVHENRTCFEARVPEDYCPCFHEVQIPFAEAQKPAGVLLEYVNKLINDYNNVNYALDSIDDGKGNMGIQHKCLELELEKIQYASVKLPPQRLIQDPQVKNQVVSTGLELSYRVTIVCKAPSNAVIEGVVIKRLDSGNWEPMGELERNNKYGNTSSCVADRVMKKICHCIPVK